MKDGFKTGTRRRLKRIEGQVCGLQRMIDEGRPCLEMLQQLSAVRAAIEQVSVQFLTEHLQTCVLHSDPEDGDGCCEDLSDEQQTAEIKSALRLYLRHKSGS